MRRQMLRVAARLERSTGIGKGISRFLTEEIPESSGWPQVFGSVCLFLFLTQALTGILLAFNYAPTAGEAYTSFLYIRERVAGGKLIQGLHHWGANFMVVMTFVHMAQVFIYRAYRRPREGTWIAGVVLLLFVLSFGLTGYLLPWDNRAYWGTVVTSQIAGGIPLVGPVLTQLIGSAAGVGVLTFARFYTLHTVVLPILTLALISFHVRLVRKHGVTPNPNDSGQTKPFYPHQAFRDVCAVFIIFSLVSLAAAFIGVPLERPADPTDLSYVPRPEWYFLFLFQLLKFFNGRMEIIGTVVIPSLAICALLLLPFLRAVEKRFLSRPSRAIVVVILVASIWAGLTAAAQISTPSNHLQVQKGFSPWAEIPPEQIAGYRYFEVAGCSTCHNLVSGDPKPGPTLGLTKPAHPQEWLAAHLAQSNRSRTGEGAPALSIPELNALSTFVENLTPALLAQMSGIGAEYGLGAQVYVNSACASCHKVNGEGGAIAPALNGLSSRRSPQWLRDHFKEPARLSPGSIMPAYHFSKSDEEALVEYLLSLPE